MTRPRGYLEPGSEVDCAYFADPRRLVRALLTLPSPTDGGRLRLSEDVRADVVGDDETADCVSVSLLDGQRGTPCCLLDCFLKQHQFVVGSRVEDPLPPPYPVEVFLNTAIVGSGDPEQRYEHATVQSTGLLDFFGRPELTAVQAANGTTRVERARADAGGLRVQADECVAVSTGDSSTTFTRFGELTLHGEPRTLLDWAHSLAEMLALFGCLADKPLVPERVSASGPEGRTDFYASWSPPHISTRTTPPLTARDVAGRLDEVVAGWLRLSSGAPDLVDHVIEYQLRRDGLTSWDRVLVLCRCLELYHDYCERFPSTIRAKADHRALVREVLAALPEPLRDAHGTWIESALFEANRRRLVSQLQDVLDDLGPDVTAVCGISDAAEFASVSKSARNYFTHPTGKRPEAVEDGMNVVVMANRLWFVVRACLFVEIGLERTEVAAALSRSARRYLLR